MLFWTSNGEIRERSQTNQKYWNFCEQNFLFLSNCEKPKNYYLNRLLVVFGCNLCVCVCECACDDDCVMFHVQFGRYGHKYLLICCGGVSRSRLYSKYPTIMWSVSVDMNWMPKDRLQRWNVQVRKTTNIYCNRWLEKSHLFEIVLYGSEAEAIRLTLIKWNYKLPIVSTYL